MILRTCNSGGQILLIGGGLGFGWVDFDAASEMGAVFDADARGGNVADDGTVFLDVNAAPSVDIANDLAVSDYVPGVNFRMELSRRAHDEFMAVERDRPLDCAVNLKVFGARNLALDFQAGAQASDISRV